MDDSLGLSDVIGDVVKLVVRYHGFDPSCIRMVKREDTKDELEWRIIQLMRGDDLTSEGSTGAAVRSHSPSDP